MIYLDNAATTMVSAAVLEAALPFMAEKFGNPGSLYGLGREARKAVDSAREQTAALFGCSAGQILFTSGGSEANSTVFRGVESALRAIGKTHILISGAEHESVFRSAMALEKKGFRVQLIPVSGSGTVNPRVLEDMLREDTGLVSVMYVNNETGAVNPVEEIGKICAYRDILFHTDCVQAAGTQKINVDQIGCDYASVSAHKLHGLKGTGALYVKGNTIEFEPLVYGGKDQEFGKRGGTENVPGIVSLGKACALAAMGQEENLIKVSIMRQRFYTRLLKELSLRGVPDDTVHTNGPPPVVPGKILNLTVRGVDAQTLILFLDSLGVCISAGSACHSNAIEPSRVLTAMGLSEEEARQSIRVSFSETNVEEEVESAAVTMANCIQLLLDKR